MTRIEENGIVIEEMIKRATNKPTGTYDEMVTFQLGAIASMLGDISKSLAMLTDGPEKHIHICTGSNNVSQNDDMELVIKVPKKLVCDGFVRPFTEEEKSILIKAIGNGAPLHKES